MMDCVISCFMNKLELGCKMYMAEQRTYSLLTLRYVLMGEKNNKLN